ncbi:MAG: beta-eliminating lyase-related protein [Pseudomonadota bacterium]
MIFTSDNASGAAPEILAAISEAEAGYAMPYGNDPVTERAIAKVRDVFEAPEAGVYFVATGTAANALALACLCPPWSTIYCHRSAHIEEDECGAPEFFTGGAKLTLLDGDDAKMTAAGLEAAVTGAAPRGVQNVQSGALSLTQATEAGAAYSLEEVRKLAAIARNNGLPVHMDGTRLANAIARQGVSPAEMTWKAGIDVLCLGATKNGVLGAEAVIIFDPDRAWEFELRRKRGGHLFSKMRFLSAQIDAYLTDDLWLRMAGHANTLADRLAAGINAATGARVTNTIGANILFPEITLVQHKSLQAAGAGYYPMTSFDPEGPDNQLITIRLVTSFRSTEEGVDEFLEALNSYRLTALTRASNLSFEEATTKPNGSCGPLGHTSTLHE